MKLAITLALGLAASVSLAEETKPQEDTAAKATEMSNSDTTTTETTTTETTTTETTTTEKSATTEDSSGVAAALPSLKTECKNAGGSVTRHVWVSYQNQSGEDCKVHYSKPDENAAERVLWSAKQDPTFCQQKAKEFIEKQKGWNFECAQSAN